MNDESSASKIFRTLYLSDLEAGLHRTKDEYLELFEGFEDVIDQGYDRLVLDDDGDGERAVAGMPLPIGNPGDKISHYEIERELGRGGQAIVYLAHDDKLNRNVALKVLTRTGPGSESTLQRFEREAEVCSKLDHPSICTVYDAGVARGIPFIAMQYVEGDTLSKRIAETRTTNEEDDDVFFDTSVEPGAAEDVMPSGRAAALPTPDDVKKLVHSFEQAARALHAAHEADVIHRDIKPGNIIIAPDGRPVILDFGLAQDSNERLAAITMTGDFFGTPAYMSPEQLSAHRIRLDRRTDVFSLAVTMYEAVTGQRPFDAGTREGLYQAILTKDAIDAHRVNRAVSKDLAVVLQKAMEKDRDRRYATAGELADELERIRRGHAILARPLGAHQRLGRWVQRNKLPAALIALLVGVVIGAGIYLKISTQQRIQREAAERAAEEKAERDRIIENLMAEIDAKAAEMEGRPFSPLDTIGVAQKIIRKIPKLPDGGMELISSLHGADERGKRLIATFILPAVPDIRATELLAELTHDDDDDVRIWASQNIMVAEHPDIIQILADIHDTTTDEKVRVNAMFGMCRNDSQRGFELAETYIMDEDNPRELRAALGQSAMMLHHPGMFPVVKEFASWLPASAEVALEFIIAYFENIGTTGAIEELTRLAEDEEQTDGTREKAREALDKMVKNVE